MESIKNYYKFFFCPASDYLNQYNETGSHGQISYYFIKHLAKKIQVKSIFAITIKSIKVKPIIKTKIEVFFKNKNDQSLKPYHSFFFYILSYFKFKDSKEYKQSNIVHHIIPFAFGYSFNLFFIFKDKSKKYILGPIIGPHINAQITSDEQYVFTEKKSIFSLVNQICSKMFGKVLVTIAGKLLWNLSKKTYQQADIVYFSDQHAYNYHKKYLLPNQKGLILDTGIDTQVFRPSNAKLKREGNNFTVLFVGRLTKRKGCEYLIKAIYEAKKIKKDIQIKCLILGVGPLKTELENLVRELNIENIVTFLGGVDTNDKIVNYYHKVDIVCLPALSETFTVAKEAMACGKPVIITKVGSHAERIKDGIDGFVIPPADSLAIANVFVKLSNEPKLIDLLSKNALKTRKLYDWDYILDKYIKDIQ